MIYIILAILVSTGIVILFKLFNQYRINNLQAITFNYAVAALFGYVIYRGDIKTIEIPGTDWFYFAILIGFLFISVFFVFALSAQKAGVAITSVSSKMSVIIPVIIAVLFYPDESMNLRKAMGVLFTLMAFYFIFRNGKNPEKSGLFLILPVLLFFGNGLNDSLLNFCERNYSLNDSSLILFLNIIFSTSLILGCILVLYNIFFRNVRIQWKNVLAGAILGLLNFGSTYYVLKSLNVIQASLFFPVFNAGIVGFSAIIGYFAFKEKLRLINWLGILFAIIAICLIAVS